MDKPTILTEFIDSVAAVYAAFGASDAALLDVVGEDNICFETDYPHTDTTWPHTAEYVEKVLANVPDEIVHKILRGNALNMLSLDEHLQVVR